MKNTSILLIMILFLASVGRAQVVLPSGTDYTDPYNYYRDCVSSNSADAEDICERQTSTLFPEEVPAQESANDSQDDLAAFSPQE